MQKLTSFAEEETSGLAQVILKHGLLWVLFPHLGLVLEPSVTQN